jgi:thymidylate synthase (FAD)
MAKIEVRLNPDTPPTGSDLSVVNAARRSFNTRSEWGGEWLEDESGPYRINKLKDKDKRLIEFLARGMTADDFDYFKEEVQRLGYNAFNQQGTDLEGLDLSLLVEELWQWRNTPTHDTPFSHTFISFEVKAPIFVRAQLVKHEYLIMSEISRRYITDGIEFYEHDYRNQSKNKKQGSEGVHEGNTKWQVLSKENSMRSLDLYHKMIDAGVAIEQARGELPLNLMVEWTWSGTLGAFAKMCRERLSTDAQYEARLVAQGVYKYLKEYFPVSAPALVEGVL